MRALSLTQPWASLVAWDEKRYETRDWSARERGWIAIVASKGFPKDARELCHAIGAERPPPMKKSGKAVISDGETTPAGLKVRADWTELCRVIGAAPRRRLARPGEVPKALRYLLDERIRQLGFFLLDPARQRALEASGRDKGLPVRLTKKEVRLHRDWRWRLIAAGCDAAYPFATIGDSGSPWA